MYYEQYTFETVGNTKTGHHKNALACFSFLTVSRPDCAPNTLLLQLEFRLNVYFSIGWYI